MARRSMNGLQGVVPALFIVATIAASVSAQERIDRSLPAARDGTVYINNVSGSVRVEGVNEARVSVSGTLGEGTERLDFTSEGRRTEVRVILPRHARNVEETDLVVRVPKGSRVEVEAVSASVDAEGITGGLDLGSVSGDVTAQGNSGEMSAQTVSGEIMLESASAEVTAESVSGDITVKGVSGAVDVSTVSGDVWVTATGAVKRLRLNSVSGELEFTGGLTDDATVKAETHSGDVTFLLPERTAADFEISTFSGSIQNDLGPKAKRAHRHSPGQELQFTTREGTARVEISTFSGTVNLLAK